MHRAIWLIVRQQMLIKQPGEIIKFQGHNIDTDYSKACHDISLTLCREVIDINNIVLW